MLARPTMWDPKYRGLETTDLLRQVDRDKMLYDVTTAMKNKNNDTNDVIYNETTGGLNYYKNNVDDFIRDDEIEHKPKSRKQEIKDEYAELRYTQDVLKGRLHSEISMWLVVYHIGLIILLAAICSLDKLNFSSSALIFGISVILSILYTQVRKNMITNKIQEIDDELTDLRTELHQINANNKKQKDITRTRKIQKAREEFVDDQVSML